MILGCPIIHLAMNAQSGVVGMNREIMKPNLFNSLPVMFGGFSSVLQVRISIFDY